MNKLTTILLGAAILTGCQANKEPVAQCDACTEPGHEHDLAFFSEERKGPNAVRSILDAQADRGAADDAMLRPVHFDGATLNTLGTARLESMVRGTAADQPVAIYLDLPEDGDQTSAREEAVIAYLSAQGIEDDRLQVESGDNPALRHLASLTSAKRYKVEGQTIGSAEAAESTAATEAPAGAAAMPAAPAR